MITIPLALVFLSTLADIVIGNCAVCQTVAQRAEFHLEDGKPPETFAKEECGLNMILYPTIQKVNQCKAIAPQIMGNSQYVKLLLRPGKQYKNVCNSLKLC
ncbi:hypothetical protein Q1695_013137 [Nippostrongylus brasiliensis]|nr:hypothetical protein Q1695_013137 [Nippostrongylus brasiliensis]